MSQKILLKRSNVVDSSGNPKLPDASSMDYGELAVNYAAGKETISIKNSNNEIVTFKSNIQSFNYVEEAPIDGILYGRKDGEWISLGIFSITIIMETNQTDNSDINSIKATVTYDKGTMEVANGETFNVEVGTICTISFPNVNGYKKPDDITITASTYGSTTKTAIYKTESITVTVTTEDSTSVIGQVVTINNSEYILDDTGKVTLKIPFGTTYSISVNNKSNYMLPQEQTFTANQAYRDVSMVYNLIKLGVYIQDINGNLWNYNEWDSNYNGNANAIGVITNNVKVLIALTEFPNTVRIYSDSKNVNILQWITATTVQSQAILDYNGKSNTDELASIIPSDSYAAGMCLSFTFPDGSTKGHLASLGEWNEVYQNKTAVDAALLKCGGTALSDSYYYWSSTFYGFDTYDATICWMYKWSGNINKTGIDNNAIKCRAFSTLNI